MPVALHAIKALGVGAEAICYACMALTCVVSIPHRPAYHQPGHFDPSPVSRSSPLAQHSQLRVVACHGILLRPLQPLHLPTTALRHPVASSLSPRHCWGADGYGSCCSNQVVMTPCSSVHIPLTSSPPPPSAPQTLGRAGLQQLQLDATFLRPQLRRFLLRGGGGRGDGAAVVEQLLEDVVLSGGCTGVWVGRGCGCGLWVGFVGCGLGGGVGWAGVGVG